MAEEAAEAQAKEKGLAFRSDDAPAFVSLIEHGFEKGKGLGFGKGGTVGTQKNRVKIFQLRVSSKFAPRGFQLVVSKFVPRESRALPSLSSCD